LASPVAVGAFSAEPSGSFASGAGTDAGIDGLGAGTAGGVVGAGVAGPRVGGAGVGGCVSAANSRVPAIQVTASKTNILIGFMVLLPLARYST
jgi:hypothetical protein